MIAVAPRKRGLFGQSGDADSLGLVDAPSLGASPITLPEGAQPTGMLPQGPGGIQRDTSAQGLGLASLVNPTTGLPGASVAVAPPRPGSNIAMRGDWENSFPTMQQQPPAKKPNWMHGGKLHAGDAFLLALAALGGAAGNQGAGDGLAGIFAQRKANIERQRIAAAMRNQGYSDDQVTLAMIDPASIGKNFNERFGTRVVAPGSAVVGDTPFGQRPQYRQPTDGEQYANAQGLEPGSEEYGTALQDYTLRGNGPTAYGFDRQLDDVRTGNDIRLEGARQTGRLGLESLRQQNRVGLEGARQGNRLQLRTVPQARAPGFTSPHRAARPTATGPNGQKVEWDGHQWVPAQ